MENTRKNKFRVWNKKYKFFDVAPADRDILVGGDGTVYEKFEDSFGGESFENYRAAEDYEVFWSTGQLDKNGNEIYEGDIVSEVIGNSVSDIWVGDIVYYKNGYYLNDGLHSNWNAEDVEVIDHIYGDPEPEQSQ